MVCVLQTVTGRFDVAVRVAACANSLLCCLHELLAHHGVFYDDDDVLPHVTLVVFRQRFDELRLPLEWLASADRTAHEPKDGMQDIHTRLVERLASADRT